MERPNRAKGFGAHFKRYTKTWQHALATAALTAFGMLTFVDRLFAIVAISAYVLPPLVLYVRRSSPADLASKDDETGDGRSAEKDDRSAPKGETPETKAGPSDPKHDTTESDPTESNTDDSEPAWRTATGPTEETLLDVVATREDAYAVGDEGTLLTDAGGEWTVAVADGPRAQSNALRGVDAVEGGGVWFAGDGGAVGRLDPATGRHVDYSAPDGDTTNLVDVAAAGSPGDETVLLVDGSGRVRRGRYRDDEVAWDDPKTPGSGSSLAGVALADGSVGYACDTSQSVFETEDGGRTFDRVGVDAADGTLTDVATTGLGACAVSTDDGVVRRYDRGRWTPERLGDGALRALALDGERGVACGDDGAVYERAEDATDWERASVPATVSLRGSSVGPTKAVAVGADGTVVERTVRGA
jgi:photosystem II stability/assembly factor-like uncharacterized protein